MYRAVSRGRMRMLLHALDSALHTRMTEKYELDWALTVEHLMPQHWEAYWKLPPQDGESAEKYADRKERRNRMLHTMGNLTMLTKSLNPTVSNGKFKKKKREILRHSVINLNRFLQDEDSWDEDGIRDRGQKLFNIAKKIWPHPG